MVLALKYFDKTLSLELACGNICRKLCHKGRVLWGKEYLILCHVHLVLSKNIISFCCFFLLYPGISRHRKHRILSVKAFYMKKGLTREITFKGNGLLLKIRHRRMVKCFAGLQKHPGLARRTNLLNS